MDSSKYLPMWNRVEPIIRKHLKDVLEQMVHQGFICNEIAQAGDAEFRLDATVMFNGKIAGGFEFTLHDGDESDGEGFGIGLGWFGDEAEVLKHAWRPHAYTDTAFTWDEDEIIARLSEFDAVHVAKLATADFLELRLHKLTH